MYCIPTLRRSFSSDSHVIRKGVRCISTAPSNSSSKPVGILAASERVNFNRRIQLLRDGNNRGRRTKTLLIRNEAPDMSSATCKSKINPSTEVLSPIYYASESNSVDEHQRSLDAYLEKLESHTEQIDDQARKELESLERYLDTLKEDAESRLSISGRSMPNDLKDLAIGDIEIESSQTRKLKGHSGPRYKKSNIYATKSVSSPVYDEKESRNLYLISILLAINIAVFLFEIASPVRSSDYNLYSLPLMYGAKVNDLIMVGEWWRLVTPMFLHSGLLDVGLSSWVLLSFGPQVCKGYGTLTFLLIYILGGISGNFASFLHTSEPTIGGSGPMFAIIGAWLIYQVQNKDVNEKAASEVMFDKAVIATALSFVLANFGPIDDWTNLGAAISGIIYGYFTCPVLQVDDASTDGGKERVKDQITLIRQPANTYLGGNSATNYMLIFALLAGTTGAASVLVGFAHFRAWKVETMAAAASTAMMSWALMGLSFGLAWKEIRLGGQRGKRLQTLEILIINSTLVQLLYIILIYAGTFNQRYGPCYGEHGPVHGGEGPSREAQKISGSEPVVAG